MIFNKPFLGTLFRVLLLTSLVFIASFAVLEKLWAVLFLLIPIVGYMVYVLYSYVRRSQQELNQFVEAIQYRDFSRHYDVNKAPTEMRALRQGFNDISHAFKNITKEKETQYQYLQRIMELVDTGIISYEEGDGKVAWMNESLKQMLQLPYLKTIHSLSKRDEQLYNDIIALKPGDSIVSEAIADQSRYKVLLSASSFTIDAKTYRLIAFKNVNEALDATESKAWQKLLSVLTHEIMNSVAPIASLAETLKNRLQNEASQLNNEEGFVDDMQVGIETIKRRSEGLLRFAETYRNLNKITKPNLQTVYVRDVFENLLQLMQPTLEARNIEVDTILKEMDIQLQVDINLLEQVLINLITNAMDAVKEKEQPHIILSAYYSSNRKPIIRIADNGAGMSQEVLNNIFIPFFSTKKNGSGIGLSLCKQIMMLHKGNIQVQSVEGEGTAMSLHFF